MPRDRFIFVRKLRKAFRVRARKKKVRVNLHYLETKEQARVLIEQKIALYNLHYGHRVGKVSVRDQRTRWGSCSKKGNLSFNYRIAHIPEHLADYIVVHELCHLAQFNHSAQFWSLVAETIPDHRTRRLELRKFTHVLQ